MERSPRMIGSSSSTRARLAAPSYHRRTRRRSGRRRKPERSWDSPRKFPDFLENLLVIRRDFRVFRNPFVPDGPRCVEDEHRAFRDAVEAEAPERIVLDSVRLAHGPIPVAQ